jgi:predicted Zn-dependent peptidase
MPGRESLALGIWIKVGGRHETIQNKGISHFLEHIAFKGTKKYSCREIKESIEGIGGSLNGFTSEELTCYLVKIPADSLELTLNVLSDMVINPTLPNSEIEKEKTVILEEIKMYKDQPQSYVYELLDALLWPNQPIGLPIIGTFESVSRTTRQDLLLFKQQFYTPENIVVSAAGKVDFNKLTKLVTKIFSYKKEQKSSLFDKAKEKQDYPKLKIFHKDTEQTHLALGFHSFRRDHHLRHALGMLHIILGANMSSRLFNELREKRGLAYEIGTQVKRFQDTGAFMVHAGIDNHKVTETIKLILNELVKTKHKLLSTDEFKRAKEFYLGQLMLALEDTLEHMLWIGEYTATLDRTYYLEDIIKEVNRVTREDIRKVARQIFTPQKINLALIGPLKKMEERISNQLKIN